MLNRKCANNKECIGALFKSITPVTVQFVTGVNFVFRGGFDTC